MYIERNGTILNVSKGAFFALFEKDGWQIVKDTNKAIKTPQNNDFMSPQPSEEVSTPVADEVPFANVFQSDEDATIEDEAEDTEDYEIVLEDMTVKELKAFAAEKDIDLDGANKKEDIIGVIRAELEE